MQPDCIEREKNRDLDSAVALRLKALQIEEILGSRRGMSESCSALAALYTLRGQHPQALEMLQRALHIEESLNRTERIAECSAEIGRSIEAQNGDPTEAAAHYLQALQDYSALKRTGAAAACCEALAGIYQRQGDLERAQEMMQQAVALRSQENATGRWVRCQIRLAEILLHRNQHAEADRVLQSVRQIPDDETTPHLQADLSGLQAVVCILDGRKDQAKPLLNEAIQGHLTAGNPIALAGHLGNLANINWAEGYLDEAEVHYLCAFYLFENSQQRLKTQKTLQLLLGLQSAKMDMTRYAVDPSFGG